jgi:hypothetical protein
VSHRGAVYVVDTVSAGAILSAFLGYLPPIAALLAIFWYGVQLYESRTVQRWLRVARIRKIRKRRLKLEALIAPIEPLN